jgi:hypothetical protein
MNLDLKKETVDSLWEKLGAIKQKIQAQQQILNALEQYQILIQLKLDKEQIEIALILKGDVLKDD